MFEHGRLLGAQRIQWRCLQPQQLRIDLDDLADIAESIGVDL